MIVRRAVFGLVVLMLAAPALAAEPGSTPTVLHLNETAEHTVTRDRLTVDLRAEATGVDLGRVQAEVNRRMTAALAQVKAVASVMAASGNYQTFQATSTGSDGKAPPRWHAEQELTLTSQDFTAALALAGQLQSGGLNIGDMRFDVAPATLRGQQQALTAEALRALTARAAQIAATLGLTVARIETLNVGNAVQPSGGVRTLMMAARGVPAPAPLPVAAAGDATVSVTVNATIVLVPGK